MAKTVKRIGEIGVDAGICWIGDPCYIMHTDKLPQAIGRDWGDFCDVIKDAPTKQLDYDLGHPGLGVVVTTGYGDGVYPVFAEFDEHGTVTKVCVRFLNNNDDDEVAG